jgi:hypothetical protein
MVIGPVIVASVWVGVASCSARTAPAEAAGTLADTVVRATGTASDPVADPVLTMRNVQFRFTKDLVVGIERIRAEMKPSVTAGIVTFDDPASFALDVSGASIRLTLAQAQVLMNTRVFNYPGVNVHDLRLEANGQELVIHGSLTKGATIPFTMVGTLSLRGGRWLVVDSKEIKIGAVGVTGLLSAIHVSLQSMINTPASGQVRVEKNTMLIDVLSVLPPPHIHGVISAIDCCTRGVGLELGGSREVSDSALRVIVESATNSPNFIAIRGGRLRFGKLTMTDADLDLIDADFADPFDFFLRDYQCQLAAGDAHTTLQFGWRVRMPDFAKLSARQCPAGAQSG